jgi:predicted GNAT superfamily acetyltransferase
MKIHSATTKDIPGIMLILQSRLVDICDPNVAGAGLENSGFLIGNIEHKEIEELILDEENNIILVAKDGDEVLGYLIAHRFSEIADSKKGVLLSLESQKIQQLEKVIYYRQIAVKSGVKNVGGLLLAELLELAKKSGYKHAVCRIVHQPVNNQKSILFHQKFGFNLVGDDAMGAVVLGVYLLNLNNL